MTSFVFDHPWLSGLFGDTQTGDILSPGRQLSQMINVEIAYTQALGVVGKIPPELAKSAVLHIRSVEIDVPDLMAGTAQDGVPVPALVRQLKTNATPEIQDAIHAGMTSQDVIDTALILALQDVISLFEKRLENLVTTFSQLAINHGDAKISGRTRMQFAREISVPEKVRSWTDPAANHLRTLQQLKPRLLQIQLGGAVGDCQDLGHHATDVIKHMASGLGLTAPDASWHTNRSSLVEFSNWLAMISGTLGKFGQDIALLAQQGIDEVTLANGGGSSAMPHKNNPVLAELLVTLARFNATQISGMHHALIHEQERSGTAWALEWMLLPQMAMTTGRGLTAAEQLCGQITRLGGK